MATPTEPLKVGSVSYDPKVVTIWEGLRDYFKQAGVPTDYVLFSNYEAQVEALFSGVVDIAWNTNVAYVRSEKRAGGGCMTLAMRNTDVGFTSRLLARKDSGITGLQDLKGKRLALGSADSAQAAILPLHYLKKAELEPENFDVLRFDLDVGKHGDTGTSELEVLKAVHSGVADAGFIGTPTWITELEHGHVNQSVVESVWTSPAYCHCNFTALPGFDPVVAEQWVAALLKMDYNDPSWRRIMDLEGLTSWVPGRKDGYEDLAAALADG